MDLVLAGMGSRLHPGGIDARAEDRHGFGAGGLPDSSSSVGWSGRGAGGRGSGSGGLCWRDGRARGCSDVPRVCYLLSSCHLTPLISDKLFLPTLNDPTTRATIE